MSQNRKSSKIDAFSVKIQIGAPVIRKIYLGNQAGTLLGVAGFQQPNPFPELEREPDEERGHFLVRKLVCGHSLSATIGNDAG